MVEPYPLIHSGMHVCGKDGTCMKRHKDGAQPHKTAGHVIRVCHGVQKGKSVNTVQILNITIPASVFLVFLSVHFRTWIVHL